MEEKWVKWKPQVYHEAFENTLDMKKIIQDQDGLQIYFSIKDNKEEQLIVIFTGLIMSFRNTDEGYLLDTLSTVSKAPENPLKSKWNFFVVENSKYIEWLDIQTFGIYKGVVSHYLFKTPNDIIEVLSPSEPHITIKRI
jgi:hypothetical protein